VLPVSPRAANQHGKVSRNGIERLARCLAGSVRPRRTSAASTSSFRKIAALPDVPPLASSAQGALVTGKLTPLALESHPIDGLAEIGQRLLRNKKGPPRATRFSLVTDLVDTERLPCALTSALCGLP
jgi:hypothetical protein